MKKEIKNFSGVFFSVILILALFLSIGCEEENSTLAPYKGETYLSEITLEQKTLKPKFTWIGGYVSAFGVNRGSKAGLDSTLQWLVHTDGNNLPYPVEYGVTPEGATEITTEYGGEFDKLIEDSTYTFWIVKKEGWEKIKNNQGKIIVQSELDSATSIIREDSLIIDHYQYLKEKSRIDLYTNIDMSSVKLRGGFAEIEIIETDTSNNPLITWEIINDDVTDSQVAAVGICEGPAYDPNKLIWEVWSEDTVDGEVVYGKKNVIQDSLIIGQSLPGTRVFQEYPEGGLDRNKNYFFWIAGKDWNGEDHLRFTNYHSYITFKTW